jgi:twinkle protein
MEGIIQYDDIDWAQWEQESAPKRKIKEKSFYAEQIVKYFEGSLIQRGNYLPWDKRQNFVGLRPSEVSVWAGINGHGKSLLLGQVVLSLAQQEQKCLIASFEMRPEITLARMARQATGMKLPSPYSLQAFQEWKKDQVFLLDHHGMINAEQMLAVCRYAASELKVNHIIIDSLMKCVKGEDDFNGQKDFVNALCAIAQDVGIHIHLVHHMRKGADEKHLPGKFDLKGSGSITDQVDNVFIVWRNKKKAQDRQETGATDESVPDALLICEKQRNGEWEGRIGLWFEPDSQQYVEENFGRIELYLQ